MKVKALAKAAGHFMGQHASLICTVTTIGTGVAVGIFSGMETLEAHKKLKAKQEALDKEAKENGEEPLEMSTKEKLKIAVPCYKKTAMAFAGVSGSAIASWKVAKNLKDALKTSVGMYTSLKEGYKIYRDTVNENVTDSKKQKIVHETTNKMMDKAGIKPTPFIETGHGDLPFFFPETRTAFYCNYEWLQKVEDELNNSDVMEVSINDISDKIGIGTFDEIMDHMGFIRESPNEDPVKFDLTETTKLPDGTPVTVVRFYDVAVPLFTD